MKKRLLITGGSGFVGGHLLLQAQPRYEIHATHLNHELASKGAIGHKIDLANAKQLEQLLAAIKPDVIIHTAAISQPDMCEQDQKRTHLVNVVTTEILARWSAEHGKRLIFTSTDMVFDGQRGMYAESDPPSPISAYARSKVAAEKVLQQYHQNWVIARVALVYGLGLLHPTSFFEKMLLDLKAGKTVTLFYDQYRSPILVNNLATALLELAEHHFVGIIHLGGTERISRWEFGLKVCEIFQLPNQNLVKKSMDDFPAIAPRPRDISFVCELAQRTLKTRLFNCSEGLNAIKNTLPTL
ncbi:MAG: SDR family oxidoreductase [candidate division KSB1 bacterium]|nr:SDR family oxidoreductase [candidate division KSB1 bacterium]MDZ7318668.1 SDR family oxidoreductase [candidate division KSB1 bacterium]